LITHPHFLSPLSFLLSDCPTDSTLPEFVNLHIGHGTKHIIRISKPTYETSGLIEAGIAVHELYFDDGSVPGPDLVKQYFDLLEAITKEGGPVIVGVHCVSGIGRAPLLVSMAMVQKGMDRLDAVAFIRYKRQVMV